jgi:hypothetical protein
MRAAAARDKLHSLRLLAAWNSSKSLKIVQFDLSDNPVRVAPPAAAAIVAVLLITPSFYCLLPLLALALALQAAA